MKDESEERKGRKRKNVEGERRKRQEREGVVEGA